MVEVSFLSGVDRWVGVLGRLRDVIRQELVAVQLAEVLAARGLHGADVLDVGCGQGTQAVALARAGHHVTGLDPSAELLARFGDALAGEAADVRTRVRLVHGAGESAARLLDQRFEVILCHGVIGYLADPAPLLAAVSEVATPTATLSLLVRNGLAPAMREGLRGNPRQALEAFDQRNYVNGLGLSAYLHTPDELRDILGRSGWRPADWYGVRVFGDHRDEPVPSAEELSLLLAAEREAGNRDPYRQVAALLHLTYHRQLDPRRG